MPGKATTLRNRREPAKKDMSWLEWLNDEEDPHEEENDAARERAEKILFDMTTSINTPIIMTVFVMIVIACSMQITMTLLGIDDGSGRQKHFMGLPN